MNKLKPWKRLPIWIAISAVVVIAGIVLMALLGFNTAAERPENHQFEVKYNIIVINNEELQKKLQSYCDDGFEENGLTVLSMQKTQGTGEGQDRNSFVYYFGADVSAEAQARAESAIDAKIEADAAFSEEAYVQVYTAWHTESLKSDAGYVWRGAIAVGIVVALVYLGIRFGVGCALTGLALSVHDALFTLAVLAIARIPVYAAAPVFYAAAAAFLSLAFWLIHCMKLRSLKKESQAPVDAETAVETVYGSAWKWIVTIAGIVAAIALLLGLLATEGVRAMALPLLAAVFAATYSSLLLGPAIHVHVKRAFDKFARPNKLKYVGKEKKAEN